MTPQRSRTTDPQSSIFHNVFKARYKISSKENIHLTNSKNPETILQILDTNILIINQQYQKTTHKTPSTRKNSLKTSKTRENQRSPTPQLDCPNRSMSSNAEQARKSARIVECRHENWFIETTQRYTTSNNPESVEQIPRQRSGTRVGSIGVGGVSRGRDSARPREKRGDRRLNVDLQTKRRPFCASYNRCTRLFKVILPPR